MLGWHRRARALGERVAVRITVLPRRIIATVSVEGGGLDDDALLREAHIARGGEITRSPSFSCGSRAHNFYAQHGYRTAQVEIDVRETDDPMRVALVVRVEQGQKSKWHRAHLRAWGTAYPPDLLLE